MKECPTCNQCYEDGLEYCTVDGALLTGTIPGTTVLDSRYTLQKRLGSGGMGIVYKAYHVHLKTAHAIKVILPDLVGNDPELVKRFRQEAMAIASIRHRNVVSVTDFGVATGNIPFLVMEFINGRSLHDILAAKGKLDAETALELIKAIGAGVGAAHKLGIVHRDLKPLNIMAQDELSFCDGVKVLDFGLAKVKSGDLLGSFVLARTTGMMGSPFYMAPEQWEEGEPDRHADIYSLGVILYQMLTGDLPFKGPSIPSIMKKHLMSEPPPFSALGAHSSPYVEAVVRHALEKDPAKRPQSIEELVEELRTAVHSSPALAMDTVMDLQATVAFTAPLSEPVNRSHAGNGTAIAARMVKEEAHEEINEREAPVVVATQTSPRGETRKRQIRLELVVVGAVVITCLIGVIVAGVIMSRKPAIPKQPEKVKTVESKKPVEKVETKILSEMVMVEGGTFLMGRDDVEFSSSASDYNQYPAHEVTLESFYMDTTEVTNSEYSTFIRQTGHTPPGTWSSNSPPSGQESWPVTNVSAEDATLFAEWRSKRDSVTYRLPTEEEWEFVARNGARATLYTWGDAWQNLANVESESPAAVKSFSGGNTSNGISDLIGNVWEWTQTRANIYPGNTKVQIPQDEESNLVVRGGSYQSRSRGKEAVTATSRKWVPEGTKHPTLGFRLVREP
jgi:serine/threonine protein kinase